MNTPTTEALVQYRENGRSLLHGLLTELVSDSKSIKVDVEVGERTTIYRVDCARECIGQILGSKGRNISAIRTLVSSIAARKGFRAIVEVPFFPES